MTHLLPNNRVVVLQGEVPDGSVSTAEVQLESVERRLVAAQARLDELQAQLAQVQRFTAEVDKVGQKLAKWRAEPCPVSGRDLIWQVDQLVQWWGSHARSTT